jgi:hypothetical protein
MQQANYDGVVRPRARRSLQSGSSPLLLVYPGGRLLVAVFQHGRQREASETWPDQADYSVEGGKRLGRSIDPDERVHGPGFRHSSRQHLALCASVVANLEDD